MLICTFARWLPIVWRFEGDGRGVPWLGISAVLGAPSGSSAVELRKTSTPSSIDGACFEGCPSAGGNGGISGAASVGASADEAATEEPDDDMAMVASAIGASAILPPVS